MLHKNMNLSFSGCGFLGMYHVGAAMCFKKYVPHLLTNKISGASAGAISACCMICDIPLDDVANDILRISREARAKLLGPFSPSFNVQDVLLEGLVHILPSDAYIKVSGRLNVSLTRIYDGENVVISQFNTQDDLLQALLASCFIPVFSGPLPPKFHGVRYMDGGFSDNSPNLDVHTITVSPFAGESDICPRDPSLQIFYLNLANTSIELSRQNLERFAKVLFPPSPKVLRQICRQGFDDSLRFLQRNTLISCGNCLTRQLSDANENEDDDSVENEEDMTIHEAECNNCLYEIKESMNADLPETVQAVFDNAIKSSETAFKNRGMQMLSYLTLPCTLTYDIMRTSYNKIMKHEKKKPPRPKIFK